MEPFSKRKQIRQSSWEMASIPTLILAGEDHGGDTSRSIGRGGVKDPEVFVIFDTDEEKEVEGQGKERQISVPLASSVSQVPIIEINSDINGGEGSDKGNVKSQKVTVRSCSNQKISDGDLEVEEISERDAQPMDDSSFQLNDTCTTDISNSSVEVMDETDLHVEVEGQIEVIDDIDEEEIEVEDNFETIIWTDVEEDDEEDKESNDDDEKISKTCHPMAYSCPAIRTRSWIGNQPRVSDYVYFETLDSDEDDGEEEGLLKDVSSSSSKKNMLSKTSIPQEDQPLRSLNQKNKFSEEEGSQEDEPLSSSEKKMLSKTDLPREDELSSSLNKKNKISIPPNDEPSSSLNKKNFSEPLKDEPSPSSNSAKSGKRKRDIPSKKCSISKLLVNTICNETKDIPSDSPKNELCNEDPDFFSWDDEPKIVDKSDHEKFMDELWADFDFFMCSTNIVFYNADKAPESLS